MSRTIACAALVVTWLLASSCSPTPVSYSGSPAPSPAPRASLTPRQVPTGPGSAAAALARLCPKMSSGGASHSAPPKAPTPAAVAQIEQELSSVRGLRFAHRVPVHAVTAAQMRARIAHQFKVGTPVGFYARRTRAWQTIGAIPPGTSIRRALGRFDTGQVIGYYDSSSGQLVYIGSAISPTPLEQITLAHELTHAVDDQHFSALDRLNQLDNSCQDESAQAGTAVVEGNAQFFSLQVAQQYFSFSQKLSLANLSVPAITGVPPFIRNLELWPYTAGLRFMTTLDQRGGLSAVNHALSHLPVSTEQIIHPQSYPYDLPVPVNIPDLAPKLGRGWSDLDVEQVGEEWLSNLLGLRLSQQTAASAAAGWGGAIYRSWSNGTKTAVVMRTIWDTPQDATQFASAMNQWIRAGSLSGSSQRAEVLGGKAKQVIVLFASNHSTLASLSRAVPHRHRAGLSPSIRTVCDRIDSSRSEKPSGRKVRLDRLHVVT